MPDLRYEAPGTLADAVKLLASAGGTARILAGGTDIIVQMETDLIEPELLIDIKCIPDLHRIVIEDGGFRIGAAVSGMAMMDHPALCATWPGVIDGVKLIGSIQVKGRATMAGNLCNASPGADSVPPLVTAGAIARVVGPGGTRDVPVGQIPVGPGKTSLAKAFARSIAGTANRIQFTPDLLPSDVVGVSVWNRATSEFEFRPGAVFAHVVLADEINRASPKTQSALLEAMQERQVTVESRTWALPRPFLVIATQNPVELEGTYPLPEAQLDRFLMRLPMGYPSREAEVAILETHGVGFVEPEDLTPVASAADIAAASDATTMVHVAPALREYIVDLVKATRRDAELALGVSPRGALALQRAAQTLAAGAGREYVIPDDVKVLAPTVLTHRMLVAPEAELRGVSADDALERVLADVPVPRAAG